jgi:hypothetical protein
MMRKHKGPRTSQAPNVRKHVRTSALRRQQLFGAEVGLKQQVPTIEVRSKDVRTPSQVTGLIDWVCNISSIQIKA